MIAPALRVAGLDVPFGETPGLVAVSFEVPPGERLVLVGASGAGKTSLLRAIAGLGPCSGGRVEIGGRDVVLEPPERRDAVYLHQTPLLFPHLSVLENVAFPLRVRRVARASVEPRVREALAAVRLEPFADRVPRTLSGGQRHRVALARAVVARPTVLLLDEPLASLDPSLREEVRQALLSLQRAYGPALVLVTHDLDDAGLLGDRIGVLLGGRLAQIAPPAELFARPQTLDVARFLGLPNFVPGRVEGGRFECPLGTIPLDTPRRPGPAVAVFRADALRAGEPPGIGAHVVEIRHRARETAALVAVGDLRLEARLEGSCAAAAGTELWLALDPRAVTILET